MNNHVNVFLDSEIVLHGTSLASGIARGTAYLLKTVDLERLQNDKRKVSLVSSELALLELAVQTSKDQISGFMESYRNDASDKLYPIFEAEFLLLNDPVIVSLVRETIELKALKCETVLAGEIAKMRDEAAVCTDPLKVKTLVTMQDLYYRILYNLQSSDEDRIPAILQIPQGSILVADRLTPLEVAIIPMDKVAGIVIEEGTRNSHASILAQTLGVPVIIDVPGIGALLSESTSLVIDAYSGSVFLNPSQATLVASHEAEQAHADERFAVGLAEADASTVCCTNGTEMRLLCNASYLADIIHAHNLGIREIGLFRSEIRYLAGTVLPTPEQEVSYYTGLFAVEGIACTTIRLLDMGGDKLPVYMSMEKETDPQLGCRGIRLLLSRPILMKKQIRAILTARGTSSVRLLLPFVTTVEDVTRAQAILSEVAVEMNITKNIPLVGIMVEVPSVALSIEQYLPYVDFVCLGTNDLAQYFFAVNREQSNLQRYYRFTHPAFLQLVAGVIAACVKYTTELSVCGEMAADYAGSCLLAAAGATTLSVQPDAVLFVRRNISTFNITALQTVLPDLFNLASADEVECQLKLLGIG